MKIFRSQITILANRQRSAIEKAALNDLVESILKHGLFHAPVFDMYLGQDEKPIYRLIAGERRMRAIDIIAERKLTFVYNNTTYEPGEVPCALLTFEDKLKRKEAEFDENHIRVDLPWQDKTKALAEIHALRQQQNPQQTVKDTTTEIMTKQALPQSSFSSVYNQVREANVIAQHLDKPEIANARNEKEAYQLVLQQEQSRYEAELLRRQIKKADQSLRCEVRTGSAFDIMPQLDSKQFDLILTDPPYGVDAGSGGYRARAKHHHNYVDTADYAREILQHILTEGWRVTKLKANIFIFTDIKHFEWLQGAASRMGWVPWRYPVIWQKSQTEGLVPWGRHGFAHTFDVIFWATKGQRGLNGRHPDILTYPRVARNDRVYAAEKPVDLLKKLIELTTIPNDAVLDPCCGSGSTLVAAKELKRQSLGIELDPKVADLATVRTTKGDTHADFSILSTDSGDTEGTVPENPLSAPDELREEAQTDGISISELENTGS